MPIHPGMVEDLAARTRDLHAAAEERLLGIIARALASGWDAPDWAERKLAGVQALRRASQQVVDELGKATSLEVFDVIAEAYNTGHRAGVAELGVLDDETRALVDERVPQAQAIDRIAAETIDVVTATHRSILRAVVDGFRAVVSEVVSIVAAGTGTRRQATQDAMRRFADRGIRAFRDRAGRRWSLTAYAEMAVRTGTARAATEAHMRTLQTAGIELVIVSDSPRECPLCRPWEREVLTLDGTPGARTVEVEHAIEDGRMVRVRVAGSLDEARLAGLQHPNCRHSVSAYTPGLTRTGNATSDPDGYEAGQRQRAIERNIRRYKNRAAASTTPEGRRAANAKVRQWQGRMRDHLAAHPDLRRLRHREQEGASNLPPEQRAAARRNGTPPPTAPPPEQQQAARVRSGDNATMREMTDDQLATAIRADSLDDRDRSRIAAEFDRRYPPAPLPEPAATGDAVLDAIADRTAVARVLAPMPDPDGWGALADDESIQRAAAERPDGDQADDEAPRITRAQARQMYEEYVYRQYLAAEDDLRGYLLNKRYATRAVDPVSLFSGPARIAYARASDELKEWWAEHGRLTQAEFIARATGLQAAEAERAAKNNSDQQGRR